VRGDREAGPVKKERNMRKLMMLALVLTAVLAGQANAAKKLVVLNFNKGEIPADNWGCSAALSEEHADAEGEFTLKVDLYR